MKVVNGQCLPADVVLLSSRSGGSWHGFEIGVENNGVLPSACRSLQLPSLHPLGHHPLPHVFSLYSFAFFCLNAEFSFSHSFLCTFFLTSFYMYRFTFISWLFWAIPRLWGRIPEQWSDLFGNIQVTACLKLQERLWWVQPAAFSAESNASPYSSSETHRHFSVCT